MQTSRCFVVYRTLKSRLFSGSQIAIKEEPHGVRDLLQHCHSVSGVLHCTKHIVPHKQQQYCYLFSLSENPVQHDTVWSADGSFSLHKVPFQCMACFFQLLPPSLSLSSGSSSQRLGRHLKCRPSFRNTAEYSVSLNISFAHPLRKVLLSVRTLFALRTQLKNLQV